MQPRGQPLSKSQFSVWFRSCVRCGAKCVKPYVFKVKDSDDIIFAVVTCIQSWAANHYTFMCTITHFCPQLPYYTPEPSKLHIFMKNVQFGNMHFFKNIHFEPCNLLLYDSNMHGSINLVYIRSIEVYRAHF